MVDFRGIKILKQKSATIGAATAAIVLICAPPCGAAPYFSGLGLLSTNPGSRSEAHDVSADGSVVTGFASTSGGPEVPFVWTRSTGLVTFAPLPGQTEASGEAISGDGSIVAGTSFGGGPAAAPFRWTQTGGTQSLGFNGEGTAMSADGTTIVGRGGGAWRWTNLGGRVFIGDSTSQAFGVSADGSVVIGNVSVSGHVEAFRWTATGGIVPLGELPGGAVGSQGRDVSNDGTVVVGATSSALGNEGFRWTAADGMQGLGDLPGGSFSSDAIGISGDGSVLVGTGNGGSGTVAVYWDATGIHDLRDVLVNDVGLDLTGWTLSGAYAASDDGKLIVGYGIDPHGLNEAFIADLHVPEPATAAILVVGLIGIAMPGPRRTRS